MQTEDVNANKLVRSTRLERVGLVLRRSCALECYECNFAVTSGCFRGVFTRDGQPLGSDALGRSSLGFYRVALPVTTAGCRSEILSLSPAGWRIRRWSRCKSTMAGYHAFHAEIKQNQQLSIYLVNLVYKYQFISFVLMELSRFGA